MRVILLSVALATFGCAGSLEAARPPRAVALAAAAADRCASLDTEHRIEGGLAKAFAVAGGASGVSTIPITDRDGERALAIASISSVAVGVALQFMSDAAAASWARECSK